MSIRYSHTNLIAKDWRKLADFYIQVFDCKSTYETHLTGSYLEKGTGLKNAKLKGINLLLPGFGDQEVKLEIFQYSELLEKAMPAAANRLGFGHIAFLVDDLLGILEKALAHGANKLGEVASKEYQKGISTYVYITDPEGNIVEIQNWEPR